MNRRYWNFLILIISSSMIFSCRPTGSFGFYSPMTMNMKIPDGPPEFKAGWYAGCKSANANGGFANSFVYEGKNGPYHGSGVYQHDPYFQIGWKNGFSSCVAYIGTFLRSDFAPTSKGG